MTTEEEPDEDLLVCDQCEEPHPEDDTHELEGETYCSECYDGLPTCYSCSDTIAEVYATTADDAKLCESCYDATDTCSHCHESYYDTCEFTTVDYDFSWCESCRSEDAYTCVSCCDAYSESHIHYHDGNDEYYCSECLPPEEEDEGGSLDTDVLRGKDTALLPKDLTFGLELESTGVSYDELNPHVNVYGCQAVHDGSVTAPCAEVNMRPTSGDALFGLIDDVTAVMRSHGATVDKSCGVHLHVAGLREEQLPRLVNTYLALERVFYAVMPPSRLNNSYAKPLAAELPLLIDEEMDNLGEWWYGARASVRALERYEGTRYRALNLHSYFYRGTVEFRHHSGTLNPLKLKMWCRFVSRVIEWSRRSYNRRTLEEFRGYAASGLDPVVLVDIASKMLGFTESERRYFIARCVKFNGGALKANAGTEESEDMTDEYALSIADLTESVRPNQIPSNGQRTTDRPVATEDVSSILNDIAVDRHGQPFTNWRERIGGVC